MLSENKAKFMLRIVLPILIGVISFFICTAKIPETPFMQATIESLDENKNQVLKFSVATLATSTAISALPGDLATPVANLIAGMDKFTILILSAVFVEKLLAVEGVRIAFAWVIPIACVLYVAATLFKCDFLRQLGMKIAIFGLALVLVVPCSTHLGDYVCDDYMTYVDETIEKTITNDSSSNTDKLANISEIGSDTLDYFKDTAKGFMNSIAIFVVNSCVIPVAVLLIFKSLLKELFGLSISLPKNKYPIRAMRDKDDAEGQE